MRTRIDIHDDAQIALAAAAREPSPDPVAVAALRLAELQLEVLLDIRETLGLHYETTLGISRAVDYIRS